MTPEARNKWKILNAWAPLTGNLQAEELSPPLSAALYDTLFCWIICSTNSIKIRLCIFLIKTLIKVDYIVGMYFLFVTFLNCAEWNFRCWRHWMHFVVRNTLNVNLTYWKGSAEQVSMRAFCKARNKAASCWLIVGYLLLWYSELVLVSFRAGKCPHPDVSSRW